MRYLTYLVLVVSTSLNAGTIHKWVDENGNVHYGDAPPVKTKTENVRVQSASSVATSTSSLLPASDGLTRMLNGLSAGIIMNRSGFKTPSKAQGLRCKPPTYVLAHPAVGGTALSRSA
jgi:hypothetical protein